MTPTLQVPLRVENDGSMRVGQSRVLLEVVVWEHERRASPRDIAQAYDTLELADVCAVIAYYLRHKEEVAAYLKRRDHEGAEIRKQLEAANVSQPDFWKELQHRAAAMKTDDAPPHQRSGSLT